MHDSGGERSSSGLVLLIRGGHPVHAEGGTLVTYPVDTYILALLYEFDPTKKEMVLRFNNTPYALMATTYGWPSGVSEGGFTLNSLFPYSAWWKDGYPQSFVPSGWHAVTSLGDKLPDWWEETGYKRCRMKMTQRCIATSWTNYDEYQRVASLAFLQPYGTWTFADITVEFDAVNFDCTTRTAIVRPRDAFLVQPVSGLADSLFSAQNFINYDGTVPLLPGSVIPLPGSVLNIAGALDEWTRMRTPVTGLDISMVDGSGSLGLGTLTRQPANSLIDKFQRAVSGRILKL